eukprot:m.152575 g.152575  ORF g.152575 m.152575 type:complete len:164 (-) comp14262_c0_seq1:663-1154(-)
MINVGMCGQQLNSCMVVVVVYEQCQQKTQQQPHCCIVCHTEITSAIMSGVKCKRRKATNHGYRVNSKTASSSHDCWAEARAAKTWNKSATHRVSMTVAAISCTSSSASSSFVFVCAVLDNTCESANRGKTSPCLSTIDQATLQTQLGSHAINMVLLPVQPKGS